MQFSEEDPWRSLLLKKLQYLESSLFWKKSSSQYNFWGIYEISNITNITNLEYQIWFQ